MKTNNLVSYELALKLKSCGFDWPCEKVCVEKIPGTERDEWDEDECQYVTKYDIIKTPIPTLWQAAKWLREEKKLHCQVLLNGVRSMYFWQVRELVGNGKYSDSTHQYDVFECAMSDCIDAALRLISIKK